jgi:hypothetical protein
VPIVPIQPVVPIVVGVEVNKKLLEVVAHWLKRIDKEGIEPLVLEAIDGVE